MARRALSVVNERYTWATIARRTAAVYEAAVRQGSAFETRQAAAALENGRPDIVVPEGNLLALEGALS
jgi:glycogen(starch) synthase